MAPTLGRMEIDRNGLEVLSRSECLRLLATATIGRIGIHADALPTILPVNFVSTDRGIVVQTVAGSKLDAAMEHSVVAFEADHVDARSHCGWSVVVTGVARPITDAAELAWARDLPLRHWVPVGGDRYISISTELVSGRRVWVPSDRAQQLPVRRLDDQDAFHLL